MKIILAVDTSAHSDLAIEEILKFKFPETSELKIVSIIETPIPYPVDVFAGDISYLAEIEKFERERVISLTAKAAQKISENENGKHLGITTEVLTGTPEFRIVEMAEEWSADLIVVGSHGYKTWERLLLGSVSGAIVHHAPCSVLIVRAKKK